MNLGLVGYSNREYNAIEMFLAKKQNIKITNISLSNIDTNYDYFIVDALPCGFHVDDEDVYSKISNTFVKPLILTISNTETWKNPLSHIILLHKPYSISDMDISFNKLIKSTYKVPSIHPAIVSFERHLKNINSKFLHNLILLFKKNENIEIELMPGYKIIINGSDFWVASSISFSTLKMIILSDKSQDIKYKVLKDSHLIKYTQDLNMDAYNFSDWFERLKKEIL